MRLPDMVLLYDFRYVVLYSAGVILFFYTGNHVSPNCDIYIAKTKTDVLQVGMDAYL